MKISTFLIAAGAFTALLCAFRPVAFAQHADSLKNHLPDSTVSGNFQRGVTKIPNTMPVRRIAGFSSRMPVRRDPPGYYSRMPVARLKPQLKVTGGAPPEQPGARSGPAVDQ